MTDFAACTIVAHNYLPLARIVARSFLTHHPESSFYIVIVDRPIEARQVVEEGITIIPVTDIDFGADGFLNMATIYDVTEFATSVKPFALKHLLQQHECVLYLDPDIKVYSRLDELVAKTIEVGWSLTPHCLQPIPRTGAGPTEREIMAAGVYNLGYIGISRPLVGMLDWWAARLRRDAIIDVERQLFTDQRWIDLAVGIFQPHIERSTGYNVAYWNLDQRTMHRDGETWFVDDEPLRFFHFSGYDPANPHWMSKYQPGIPRVLFSERPELINLFLEYGEELLTMRPAGEKIPSYGWNEAFPGFKLSRGLRRMFRDELLTAEAEGSTPPPSPFVVGGLEDFITWCKEVPKASMRRLPRYAEAVFNERHDLQHNFHEVNGGNLERFNGWVRRQGRAERIEFSMFGYLDAVDAVANTDSLAIVSSEGRKKNGVDVVGYLQAELGVGEAGRLLVNALRANNLEVGTVNCSLTQSRQNYPFEVENRASHSAVVMAVNADQLDIVRHSLGVKFFKDRDVIGQWFWELSEPPKSYRHAFDLVREVWAPTLFIKESLETMAPERVSVVHMPLPIMTPEVDSSLTRESFGLDNRFAFLFTFDFLSVLKRKNPIGLVEAFCEAFSPNEGPVLILKSINGNKRMIEFEKLKWACRGRTDIIVIDEYFDAIKSATLMAVTDCYISLHRSEGLGLTMAEAMALGKPVIATGYSGNMDFMSDKNSILVPWTLVQVGKDAESYPSDAMWAEPNLGAASVAMRRIFDDQDFARSLGAIAQRDIAENFSPQKTGARMKSRLESNFWR
jgi:glycosyltransferase involved in cell wall biosynthesis